MDNITKTCSSCDIEKSITEFHIQKTGKHGRTSKCKLCKKEYKLKYRKDNKNRLLEKEQKYRDENRDKISSHNLKYYQNNRDKLLENCKSYYYENHEKVLNRQKIYRKNNKHKKRNNHKNKYNTDINYRLSCNIRSRLNRAIRSNNKAGSAIKDLGCDMIDLIKHIENQFYAHMTWKNYGKEWEIDHIKPLSSFDLRNRKQFLEACNYKNLKPLLKIDHYIKTSHDLRNIKE